MTTEEMLAGEVASVTHKCMELHDLLNVAGPRMVFVQMKVKEAIGFDPLYTCEMCDRRYYQMTGNICHECKILMEGTCD